jgi:peptidoglycan/LPS O-acetylase OafA/YrhL
MSWPFEGTLLATACILIGVLAALARFRSDKFSIRVLISGNLAVLVIGSAAFDFELQATAGLGAAALTATLVVCVLSAATIGAVRWLVETIRGDRSSP